jgi:hypothetical protein
MSEQPTDEVRQLLVHPAVWPYLEAWLALRGITLSLDHFEDDVLPTYVMTIRPVPCARCKGSGVDPEHSASESYGDVVRELPEPCSACQLVTP